MDIVVYQGNGDLSALYVDGKLVTYGDHYRVDEELRSILQVKIVQSDSFMLGTVRNIAKTLDEINEFENKIVQKLQQSNTKYQMTIGNQEYYLTFSEYMNSGLTNSMFRLRSLVIRESGLVEKITDEERDNFHEARNKLVS